MACEHSADRTTDTEGHKMRLVYIFAAVLAVSVAESSDENKPYEDLEAMESIELQKVKSDLTPEASAYNYVPQTSWNQNNVPASYPTNNYVTTGSYVPPATTSAPYVPPVQSDYVAPQNNYYYPPHHHTYYPPTWSTPNYHVPTTTTPIPVIKNEQYFGENGSYKYEYQIADGTHVGEEGYFTDPKGTDESLVKKGWYSYLGPDGKTYTVTYWADKTGYHAYGSHLPTPPPIPPAIQAALDKEEAEKNKPTYAPPTQKPHYPPQQPTYPQQTYPQQTYPQQTYPQQTYPQQTYPQQTYPQQTYPQQTYPQQPSNPGYGK